MADKEGWVYVLTNEAMPGLVKVGQTYKTPEIRAQELSSETGVAAQYVVVYKAFVSNYDQVEKVVHDKLKSAGKHYNKEFFKCEAFEAIRHIRHSTTIKFEESKEDVDKKIQQQKELEEKQRTLAAQQEAERQRIAYEKAQEIAENLREIKERRDFEEKQEAEKKAKEAAQNLRKIEQQRELEEQRKAERQRIAVQKGKDFVQSAVGLLLGLFIVLLLFEVIGMFFR
jgi:Fe2+ transport system protein B